MNIFKAMAILFVIILLLNGCASRYTLTTENPYSQASVVIHLKGGSKKEGIVLKRDGDNLIYIDNQTHRKEKIDYSNIQRLSESDAIYDFEANAIPDYVISEEKGMGQTMLFGAGGLVLGAAVGTGVGIALVGAGADVKPIYSIAAFGLVGAYIFGKMGAERDFEDATFDVRKKRAEVSKQKRNNEIEDEKQKLEEQRKQKEKLLEEIKKKKKD